MLSDAQLKAAQRQRRKNARRLWDGNRSGFGARVTPSGGVAFYQFYYAPTGARDPSGNDVSGKRRFMGLGAYPEVSLKEAREAAHNARKLLEQGIDPQQHAQEEREREERERREREEAERREQMRGSVRQLVDAYAAAMQEDGRREATIKAMKATLEREAIPVLGEDTKAADVRPADIADVLRRLHDRGARVQANRLRSYLHRAFAVGMEHDHHPARRSSGVEFNLERNPVRDIPKPLKHEPVRDRALDWWEIAAIWNALDRSEMAPESKALLRLSYLLGGQRFEELRGAPWAEFDFDAGRWDIPGSRTKNSRAHVVPLTAEATAELSQLHALTGHTPWLFPRRDEAAPMPAASLSQSTRRLQRLMRKEYEADPEQHPEPPAEWQPRDCRGTVKTRLSELGVPKEYRDRLQNHAVTADVAGRHYDRFDYLDEKRRALEAFTARLMAEVRGEALPENVTRIAG